MKRIGITLFAICMMLICFPVKSYAAGSSQLYCFYNALLREYLYTVSEAEKDSLMGSWEYKGVTCTLPGVSSMPVYRLLNPVTAQHLYTSTDVEINKLVAEGWTKEGVAFYVDDTMTVPVYRLLNTATGEHQFSADGNAIATLEASGWIKEGVAWYALGSSNSTSTVVNTSSMEKVSCAEIRGLTFRTSYSAMTLKDNRGNKYQPSIVGYRSDANSLTYSVDRTYKYLTGVVTTQFTDADSVGRIKIYGDGELIFYEDDITKDTEPHNITVDISKVSELKICIYSNTEYNNRVIIGNAYFLK